MDPLEGPKRGCKGEGAGMAGLGGGEGAGEVFGFGF